MIDEMLVHIFGEAVFGRIGHSKRAQLIARAPTRACMVLVFVGLACLSLFNVALARKWRWPALLFAASFVALFALRIGLGA